MMEREGPKAGAREMQSKLERNRADDAAAYHVLRRVCESVQGAGVRKSMLTACVLVIIITRSLSTPRLLETLSAAPAHRYRQV